jgi:hypothetical protein
MFKICYVGKPWARTMSFASLTDAIALTMVQWNAQHHEFIFKHFFKMATVVKMQQIFHKHFSEYPFTA